MCNLSSYEPDLPPGASSRDIDERAPHEHVFACEGCGKEFSETQLKHGFCEDCWNDINQAKYL